MMLIMLPEASLSGSMIKNYQLLTEDVALRLAMF